MIEKINRNDAVVILSKKQLVNLDNKKRESYILDWWGIDKEDEEFFFLSSTLQKELLNSDEIPKDIENSKYDELIILALKAEYKGVTNSYLTKSLNSLGMGEYEVFGEIEQMEICPCCEYKTLDSKAQYDICPLCFWEDDGTKELDKYSHANHTTLAKAKDVFSKNSKELALDKWLGR